MRRHRRSQQGSATPLLLAVVVFVVVGTTGVARVSDAAVRRARVEAAADLVALAAVDGDHDRALTVARVVGADLLGSRARDDGGVEVTLELDGVVAEAAAAPLGR